MNSSRHWWISSASTGKEEHVLPLAAQTAEDWQGGLDRRTARPGGLRQVPGGEREDRKIKLENATVDPIPVGDAGTGGQDPNMETLERIVDDFNFSVRWHWMGRPGYRPPADPSGGDQTAGNDEVRDLMLNNDEETQMQVIHDNIRRNPHHHGQQQQDATPVSVATVYSGAVG